MFQRKPSKFRRRSNGRGHRPHSNGHGQIRLRSNSFSNNQPRNNFRQTQSPERLLEKYNALAKEAMSSGDVTSCENYLQHADHFIRIIDLKNKSRDHGKSDVTDKSSSKEKQILENNEAKQEDQVKNQE